VRLTGLQVLVVEFPFRISFGHALASRKASTSVLTRVQTENGAVGYGECVPRDYVTGETPASASALIADRLGQSLLGRSVERFEDAPRLIGELFGELDEAQPSSAARCAVELGVLDALGRAYGRSVAELLGPRVREEVVYGGALPFLPAPVMAAGALAHRAYGIRSLKLKVGRSLSEDRRNLRIVRRCLGSKADLRVDANCGWTAEQAIDWINATREFRISAVEQPVPQGDFAGLKKVADAVDTPIMADESLCTLEDAHRLAANHSVDMFNIRISKCGGLLAAQEMARIAERAGLSCQLGIHPGESAILGAAGRLFATHTPNLRYFEADALNILVKQRITERSIAPGRGGRAPALHGPGLGIFVNEQRLKPFVVERRRIA
jgi:L-Ala-D/L-Glu epimerase